jgi:threonine/homoserine/homoserine lactone efflux protein
VRLDAWSTATAAGLSAVLPAHPAAYTLIRLAGGAVLAVLGVTTVWSLRRKDVPGVDRGAAVDRGRSFVSAPAMHRRLQAATGGVLVLLGVAVAAGA